MVKTRQKAESNKMLHHKIGKNTTLDKNLLHDQVAQLYEVMHTSPYRQADIQKNCPLKDFRNFKLCLSIGLCLIQKGVNDHQVDGETLSMLTDLSSRYVTNSHKANVGYMKLIKEDHVQVESFNDYSCKLAIEESDAPPAAPALIEHNEEAELQWGGRRRRRLFGWISSAVSSVEHDVSSAVTTVAHDVSTAVTTVAHDAQVAGNAIVNAAEYGAKAIKTVVSDGIKFTEGLLDCLGHTSSMRSAGYKWEICYNGGEVSTECGAGVGLWFEVTLKTDLDSALLDVWTKIVSVQADQIKGIDFSIEASLAIVLGVGIDLGIADADAGVGVEAAITYDHTAGGENDLKLEVKLGVLGAVGKESEECPFGSSLGPAKCFLVDEGTISVMCCEIDFFTGHHDCR